MKRFGTTTRIAFAMAMWTATVLLILRMTGVLSDGTREAIAARTRLCEAVAVSCSQFASRSDTQGIHIALDTLAKRNPTVISAACRRASGDLEVAVGDHSGWDLAVADESKSTCIQVPVLQGAEVWGQVEVRFESPVAAGFFGFLWLPSVRITLIAALANLTGFLILLRRCFNHLDPSQAVPDRVRSALDTMAESVLVLDAKDKINLANDSFGDLIGKTPSELTGVAINKLDWVIDQHDSFSDYLRALNNEVGIVTSDSVKLRVSESDIRTFKANASVIANEQGEPQGTLLCLADITALEEKNDQLRYLATRDSMTGCLNRRCFFEHLEDSWKSAMRYGHPISCLMVDVDHFKSINDTYGHGVGDDVLRGVSKALLDTARETDYVCRYGGEEFCVLLPHIDIEGVFLAGERYRKAIEALEFPQLKVTASLGCSSAEFDAETAEQMLDQADKGLYFAKRNGRNRVGRFDQLSDGAGHAPEAKEEDAAEEKDLLNLVRNLMSEAREAGKTSVEFDHLTQAMGQSHSDVAAK